MLKSEHFVTISLDTNECDICHQCTGEMLVTCRQCFQPATDEPVREGFNRLLGVVHRDHQGHEACFTKAHQVLSQSLSNRKLSSDSVTSQLKGLLDGKLQQIMKYARNEGNLGVPQPQEVKSMPCSRTSSPLRGVTNTRFEPSTKRKCNSDENIALRHSRRPALVKVPTIYDREKCEGMSHDNKIRHDRSEMVEISQSDKNGQIRRANKIKDSYLHEAKFVKTDCAGHDRECDESVSSRETIQIPSDRFVYLPCEHQYASEGWTVTDLICDICEHHHHRTNQLEQFITSSSQSESSTDNDFDDLLPVVKSSNKDVKEIEHLKEDFKTYSNEELKITSGEELCEILDKLKTSCTDVSSNLVALLQERDDLKHEVKVRHLMIEKLVSIQSTE